MEELLKYAEYLLSIKRLYIVDKKLKRYEELLNSIIQIGDSLEEKLFLIYYKINPGLCKICGMPTEFLSLKNGYKNICKETNCKNKWTQRCKENAVMDKYGVKNIFQVKDVIEHIKDINLERYGNQYYFSSEEGKIHIKDGMMNKYGVDNPMKSDQIKNAIKDKCMNDRGVLWPLADPKIQKMIKKTWNDRGFNRNSSTEEWLKSVKKTNNEKFGVDFPAQSSEYFQKQLSSLFTRKQFIFPSGKIVNIQGYEDRALNELLNLYDEDDIVVGAKEIESYIGKIFYIDNIKLRRYFPDIYIRSTNIIIEVKSDYIFKLMNDINLKKRQQCLDLGFNFEFFIYEKKGKKIEWQILIN